MNLIQVHKILLLTLISTIIIICEMFAIYVIFGKTVESGIGCILAVFGIIYIDMIAAYAIDKKTNIIDKIFDWIDK